MATESDNVNSGALGTLVAVGTFAMLGISLVVTALVRAEVAEEVGKKEVAVDRPYRDLVAEQQAQLSAPAAYKDRGKGLISLPIDRAMDLTVSGLAKDPNSATPPPPVGGSSGSAATEAGGSSGMAGAGGTGGTGGAAPAEVDPEATPEGQPKPAPDLKQEGDKPEGQPEKKEAPKPAPKPVPAAPTPAAPTPAPAAPAPAPPPNGQ